MHNNQARLRSVELGRSTVRAANTGVSSFITPAGDIIGAIPPLEGGYLCADLSLNTHRTLYSYIGNTFVHLCTLAVASAFGYFGFCKIREAKAKENGISDSKEEEIL
jgi:apolipoprotein N-acyltransferase